MLFSVFSISHQKIFFFLKNFWSSLIYRDKNISTVERPTFVHQIFFDPKNFCDFFEKNFLPFFSNEDISKSAPTNFLDNVTSTLYFSRSTFYSEDSISNFDFHHSNLRIVLFELFSFSKIFDFFPKKIFGHPSITVKKIFLPWIDHFLCHKFFFQKFFFQNFFGTWSQNSHENFCTSKKIWFWKNFDWKIWFRKFFDWN